MSSEYNENEVVRELAAATVGVQKVTPFAVPHAVVPSGYEINSLERFLPAPLSIGFQPKFVEPESFNRYVNEHKSDNTRIYSNEASGVVVGVIDHVAKDSPSWMKHRPTLILTHTPEWTAWIGANRKQFSQVEFAEFLEEHAGEISEPTAASMMDVALSLKAKNDVAFSSAVRLDNGQASLAYEENIRGQTGTGNIDIPTRFKLIVPVFKGVAPFVLDALLRWRFTKEKGVTFHYVIQKWEKAKEQSFREVLAGIADTTGIKPFVGVGFAQE